MKNKVGIQLSSVAQSCPTLYDPMRCNTPCFPVLHYLPEFAQIHFIESVMLSNISPFATLFFFCLQSLCLHLREPENNKLNPKLAEGRNNRIRAEISK